VKALLFGVLLALAGCASQPGPPGAPGAVFANTLSDYPSWSLRGRVSLVQDDRGWHAGMHWREATGQYRLDLAGPLGQGALEIDGVVDGIIRLRTADGQQYVSRNADALVQSVTGWQLPVTGLRYWVRGVPAPGGGERYATDDRGRLLHLEQSGWEITYRRYAAAAGRDWPTRMHLETPGLALTLVVDEWSVAPAAPAVPP